ncbi:Catechol 2,3-dioxygenase [Halomicrobium zhouii]|uniref:Catechol 2,3-dioxygenase n=1 Tax=Halomicrobium zhouii TaxID=767519 RepID=A0A1I6KKA0_9EURY|nr:VOC family protein [Halomicrobium zhouii]SFR91626.1 Catechol 2,3-dioxygenase [Halomicrobium zhouii]
MTTDPSTDEAPVTATPPESAFRTTGLDHVTLVGSNEAETIEFYRDVLGMPLVLRQPNLDQPEVTHLFFDTGDGRILTFFVEDDRDSSRQPLRTPVGGVHHVAFTVDPERFDEVKSGLSENGYQFNEFDRGIFHSLYTRDHNGLTLEFATDKYEIPDDRRGEVLALAHAKRVDDGAEYAKAEHLEAALSELGLDSEAVDLGDAATGAGVE